MTIWIRLLGVLGAFALMSEGAMGAEMKVGVGRSVITPSYSIWMAGYASRTAPSEGKIHDLYAKAIAIEDESGTRSVIVTSDLLGIPANIAHRCVELVQQRYAIPRERLMLTSSHTHCGPVVRTMLIDMYALDDENSQKVTEYTDALPELILKAVDAALNDLKPASLDWGIGSAGFAKNRRQFTLDGVTNGFNPIGPVDHDVPVLVAKRPDGSIQATLFGYACHNTTLSFQQLCGDYAGFAQAHIESAMPGCTALFVAGCGGDQNPLPRGTIEHAQQYGKELGDAVLAVCAGALTSVYGPIRAAYEEIPLKLSEPPTREAIEQQLKSDNVYIQRRAKRMIERLDREGSLSTTYPYPVQVWTFGDTLQMTALAGEVVVDYSLLIKHEYPREKQFVIAYANDVFAYIPSLRVLREGGYEGESAMIYYGLHGPWAPTVEQDIMASVKRLAESLK